MRKARSYAHIAAAKKWNNVFRLSALSQQKRAHEKHFRRVRAGQFRINEKGVTLMFARGVEVIAKPSKTLKSLTQFGRELCQSSENNLVLWMRSFWCRTPRLITSWL